MVDIGTAAGTQLKLEGLDKVSKRFAADLTRAKEVAVLIAMQSREPITSDAVRDAFLTRYGRELLIGNAIGGLFLDRETWEYAGRTKSTRAKARARWISLWKLKDGAKL